MGLAAAYNNTLIPYGSRVETFTRGATISSNPGAFTGGTSLGSYIAEKVLLERPTVVIKRKDEIGGPNGSVGVQDFVNGTFTCQLATTSTLQLRPGDVFTDTFDTSLGAESFVVESASQPEDQVAYKTQAVKFIKLY